MSLPQSWAELFDRFEHLLANDHDAPMWVFEAVNTRWGSDVPGLTRVQRQIAFQKVSGVVLWMEDNQPTDLAFMTGVRDFTRRAFARYFDGAILDGPPWRLDPTEPHPAYDRWKAEADSLF